MLISTVVKQFFDSHIVGRVLIWVGDIALHATGLNQLDNVFGLSLTCIDCLDHGAECALTNLLEVDVALSCLNNFLSLFVMLLF